jgi:hypothetical protein
LLRFAGPAPALATTSGAASASLPAHTRSGGRYGVLKKKSIAAASIAAARLSTRRLGRRVLSEHPGLPKF